MNFSFFGKKKDELEFMSPSVPYYEEEEVDESEEEDNESLPAEHSAPDTPVENRTIEARPSSPGWGEWIAVSAITVVLAWFLQSSIMQAFNVPSRSMEPTLVVGDSVIINKMAYAFYLPDSRHPLTQFAMPQVGDIVVFSIEQTKATPRSFVGGDYLIKRVVAGPGDLVEVAEDTIFVNGVGLKNHSTRSHVTAAISSYKLGAQEYFVVGDNQPHSIDSRVFGPIPLKSIIGKAFIVYWSRDKSSPGYHVRWDRMGKKVE